MSISVPTHRHDCEWCGSPATPMGWSGDMGEPDPGQGAWCESCGCITYCDTCERVAIANGQQSHHDDPKERPT